MIHNATKHNNITTNAQLSYRRLQSLLQAKLSVRLQNRQTNRRNHSKTSTYNRHTAHTRKAITEHYTPSYLSSPDGPSSAFSFTRTRPT